MQKLKPTLWILTLFLSANFCYAQNKANSPTQSRPIGAGYADLSFVENQGQFPYLNNFAAPNNMKFGVQIGKILDGFTPDGIYFSKTEGEGEAE